VIPLPEQGRAARNIGHFDIWDLKLSIRGVQDFEEMQYWIDEVLKNIGELWG